MKKLIIFGVFVSGMAILLLTQGCIGVISNDYNRIYGNGEVISQSRQLSGSFEKISLAADFDVVVTPSIRDSIYLEAESNILPYVITVIEGNRLVLRTTNSTTLINHQPVRIHVFARQTNALDVSGSGTIRSDSLHTNLLDITISGSGSIKAPVYVQELKATVSGSGDIEVWGLAENSEYTISGSGNIKSYLLSQQDCISTISGSGNIYVSAWNTLDATISGSGSVYYKGNPLVKVKISGSGKVIPG